MSFAPDEDRTTESREVLLGAAAYLTILPAVVLLAIPATRSSRFVGFHAWQSVLFAAATLLAGLVLKVLFLILSVVPIVGFLFSWLLLGVFSIAIVVLWAVLIIKALQGYCYQPPVIGPMAARLAG